MIPWIVIALKDEPWKLLRTMDHLKEHGIRPMVVYGINGQLAGLRPVVPHEISADGKFQFMHPAQVGCVLSHIMALTCALAHGAEQFVVSEDDVVLADNFEAQFDEAMKALPEDAGILQLQSTNPRCKSSTIPYLHGFLHECHLSFGSASIFWKRDAARRALQMLRPIDSPFDIMLIRKVYPFVKHYIADPPLATERTSTGEWPSSVTGKPEC